MEELISLIPGVIMEKITETSILEDLPSTCSSLHDCFLQSPLANKMIDDLTDPELALCAKNKEVAMEMKERGNDSFTAGDYSTASNLYSKALRLAPMDSADKTHSLVATLYVNRASTLHKMGFTVECLRDCRRALSINPGHVKAWYRRGKANISLQNYNDAICDLKVALNMEKSSSGKRHIENDLRLFRGQKRSDCLFDRCHLEKHHTLDEVVQGSVQCISTPTKGRGIISLDDIHEGSLIHSEEPYAAIILKNCRDTHCHFCFNELPVDTVPCVSCSIPLYCSDYCQQQAGGLGLSKPPTYNEYTEILPDDLHKYLLEVVSGNDSHWGVECFAEHEHECHGMHWPAVLPSDVVLAGRVLVKSMKPKEHSGHVACGPENLDLCHNYMQLSAKSKLELHVYAIVLLYCVKHSCDPTLQLSGAIISKVVLLISQIKMNSMAIVRVKFGDTLYTSNQPPKLSSAAVGSTSNIEQVTVGQAIYLGGSMFNHSCNPNIHAYFLSRKLLIRSTEFVGKGCPLELSYGPQVGQWDCRRRQQFLEDRYFFRCRCNSCTHVNLSDLVLNAFQCVKPNCSGVILDCFVVDYERHKINHLDGVHELWNLDGESQVSMFNISDFNRVAGLVGQQTTNPLEIEPGSCLSCGSRTDLKSLHETAGEAQTYVESLKQAIMSKKVDAGLIFKGLKCLQTLQSILHPYNKKIAEAEDVLAEACCFVGKLQPAFHHCSKSLEILKKLYNPCHIVIGNELVKLSSIQLSMEDPTLLDTVNQLLRIFSRYYGSQVAIMFPYLQFLEREGWKLANERPS